MYAMTACVARVGSPEKEKGETNVRGRASNVIVNMGDVQTIWRPEGWPLRRVATALAREWLPHFRPDLEQKKDPWSVQPVVERPADGRPLWEAGISTEEYERRLEAPDLAWSVRARSGRVSGILLAHMTPVEDRPEIFHLTCSREKLPPTLFDPQKMDPFLETHGLKGIEGLITGLLLDHGFRVLPEPEA